MTDALKELFNAYKHLPVGVMFFKNQTLFFINDHLRNVLLLQNVNTDEVIRIIGEMVGIENATPELLCDFLLTAPFFIYRDKILQIERQHVDGVDIFVIVRVSEQSIKAIDETRPVRQMQENRERTSVSKLHEDEQQILAKGLGKWENSRFSSLVLYKGIPIKGECAIVYAHEGEIGINVEKKQLAAAQIGVIWLIGNKREKMVSGEIIKYDIATSTVWLNNLKIISEGFHRRHVIRYHASPEDRATLLLNGKRYVANVHDVSEQGVSILTDNPFILSSLNGKTLNLELVLSDTKISVRGVWLYNHPMENGTLMKAAFTIGYDLHNGYLLREWLNTNQLKLIKEVRSFVQMIPPPKRESTMDWVI